jgi:hypothetical protein
MMLGTIMRPNRAYISLQKLGGHPSIFENIATYLIGDYDERHSIWLGIPIKHR